MKTDHLPRSAGIYQIVNLNNGKMYVGSAVDLQVRAHGHCKGLKSKNHANQKLQNAWDKHGVDAFEFRVLEHVDDLSVLVAREQYWLDVTQCVKNGYNIRAIAESNRGCKWSAASCDLASRVKSKPITGFVTPDGKEVCILNVRTFCAQHGIPAPAVYGMAKGTIVSYKGWSHFNSKPRQRTRVSIYEGFIAPDGAELPPIQNLEKFCRENGLDPASMHGLTRGKKPSHHGYRHKNWKPREKRDRAGATAYGFINPQGEAVVIQNMAKFCRDNSLDESTMRKVRIGKVRQYKGWTYQQ